MERSSTNFINKFLNKYQRLLLWLEQITIEIKNLNFYPNYRLRMVKIEHNNRKTDTIAPLALLHLSVAQMRQSNGDMFPFAFKHISLKFGDATTHPRLTFCVPFTEYVWKLVKKKNNQNESNSNYLRFLLQNSCSLIACLMVV